jgi:hypothetical protein
MADGSIRGRAVARHIEDVFGDELALFYSALAFHHVDPELDVAFDRKPAFAHAIACKELRDIGILATFRQNASEDRLCLFGVLTRLIQRLDRAFDKGLGFW